MKSNNVRLRIQILSGLVVIFAIVLIGKLYMIQVVNGEEFAQRADRQYLRPQNIFDRGSIFFENKDGESISAATLKSGFILSINPKLIKNPEKVYNYLSSIMVNLDRDQFLFKAGKTNDPHEELATQLNEKEAEKIQDLGIEGVSVTREKWRFYPGGEMAAQTLGFVGYSGNDLVGIYGLERYYNDLLSHNNKSSYINFFAEIFTNVKDVINIDTDERKGDIIITIEPSVQAFLERTLDKIDEKWSPELTGGIIIDPTNGEIFGMAINPSFDLNSFQEVISDNTYQNPIIQRVYEMGSIIKPLTMAAGLDSGVIKADSTYFDSGSVTLNNATISNFDGKGRGKVSMQEVLSQSLNTGVVFVMQQLGIEEFSKYMKSYGLGEETGIDLPGEIAGLISNLETNREIEHATAAFGQGIAMTPIETVRALSSLGNGGKLINPHLVKKINYDLGYSREIIPPRRETQVLKPSTSDEITRMLIEVVDKALLGGTVKMERYSIAAKTGTAQIANLEEGGYYEDKNLHSFFGYFPAYNPRFLVFLYTVNPKEIKYASQTLTTPFMSLTKFLINYYEIPPDR